MAPSPKLSVSKLSTQRPFWQARYHDFNVLTHNKRVEKLHYMHQNPVTRGLVSTPEDWPWSSYRHYHLDEPGIVKITPHGPSPPQAHLRHDEAMPKAVHPAF